MGIRPRFLLGVMLCAAYGAFGRPAGAQENPAVAANQPSGLFGPELEGRFRRLAPGVERTIDPESVIEETFSLHDLPDILSQDPTFGERAFSLNRAKSRRFEYDVWALEFTFKPVRFIEVDVPNLETGRFDRKRIWYVVYHVKNVSDQPVRFVPIFHLYSWDTEKYYPDLLIPVAERPIELREDPNRRLLNSVEISAEEIPPAVEGQDNDVWGVVAWRDIDPRTDRFSIFVQGLTNAYRWDDKPDGGRRIFRKTLQLNFWRPGDDIDEHEQEIRYGIPGEVDYRWVYK